MGGDSLLDWIGESNSAALIGLLGGMALGLAARMGRFCTLGAIEDFLYSSDDRRMRMWAIAVGTAIISTHLAFGWGFLDATSTVYLAVAWNPLASIVGGLVFGYGMALCGNCGYGALARLGGGDLRSLVIVIVMGLAAYVAMSGPLAAFRIWLFPQGSEATQLQGFSHAVGNFFTISPVAIGLCVGGLLIALAMTSREMRASRDLIFWALVVGLSVTSGWIGTYWIAENGFAARSVETHTFAAPIGETLLYAMTASGRSLSFGVGSVFGVVLGACLGSFSKGHFRWEACEDPRELRRQILGAALMGVGAVVALGCSVGQGISAFSVLAFSAPVTLCAIFLGAAFGLRQLIQGFSSAV